MTNRLNVRSITTEYKKSFLIDGKLKLADKFLFFIFPYFFAVILCIIKLPDNDLKNLFGISLSIFIGLFLSVVAILIPQINKAIPDINFTERNLRLDILQDTLYNILYALLQSVRALIILYLMGIFTTLEKTYLGDLYCLLLKRNIDSDIQFCLTFFLYKFNISLILSFYVMIKNIATLFQKEINIEKLKIRNNQVKNEK